MKTYFKTKLIVYQTLILLPLIVLFSFAKKNGITGVTNSNAKSCGECHAPSPSNSVVFSINSDIDLNNIPPNTRIKFTLTSSYPSAKVSGTNIAVKNAINGTQNVGTLSPEMNSGLKLKNSELTHSSPNNCLNGEFTYNFYWTSPQDEGTYYLQAAVLMGNGNGKEDANDVWNWIQPVQITVKNQPSTANDNISINSQTKFLYFEPSSNKFTINIPSDKIGELSSIQIFDLQGKEIFSLNQKSQASINTEFSSIQEILPSGVYLITYNFLKEKYIEIFLLNK